MKYDAYGNITFRPKRTPRTDPRQARPVVPDRARRNSRRAATPRVKLTAA